MKTLFLFASSIVLMIVMYFYFIGICLYALTVLPFVKLNEFIRQFNHGNQQLAGA